MKFRNLSNIFLLTFAIFGILTITAHAQLDPTFGTNGIITLSNVGEKPMASYNLPDGKILLVSEELINADTQAHKYYLSRFNADGTPDATYGTNGVVTLFNQATSSNIFRFFNCARQLDGKMLFVGFGTIFRFNENGTLDPTFSDDGMHSPNVDQQAVEKLAAVVQQPDGKILLTGMILQENLPYFPIKIFFVRYELNGNLDQTFGDQGGFIINTVQYSSVSEIQLQSNGKILTVPQREINDFAFYSNGAINRFNSNGTVDNSFAPIFYAGGTLRSFKLLNDDKFAVAESLLITDPLFRKHRDIVVSRYTSSGVLDTSFGTNGKTSFDITSAMTDNAIAFGEQADGKLVVSGVTAIEPNRTNLQNGMLSIARLNTNGTLDGKYLVTNQLYYAPSADDTLIYQGQVLVQPNGKIITASTRITPTSSSELLLTRSTNIPLEIKRLHGISFAFLYSGFANASIYRPSSRNWYFNPSVFPTFFGLTEDVLAPADFLSDFKTDLAVFRPSEGTWYIAKPGGAPSQNYLTVQWGKSGDIPIPRDYDGDSKADIAVFRPEKGIWYIRNSADNSPTIIQWGISGDKPVAGDYDGDGFDDIAVWRPSNGVWYIRRSSNGLIAFINFGINGDIPVQDDYDGDGKTDIAVWRPSTGVWYILRSSDSGYTFYTFGLPGDIPIPSDFDGDRKTDIGVWRPSNLNWYIISSGDSTYNQFLFGLSNDVPTQGRY